MDYLTRIRARGSGNEPNVPGHLHDKNKATRFVEMIGERVTAVLRSFSSPDEIDLEGLPEWFVLKPTFSSSSLGVMVLERDIDGYRDHLRNRSLRLDDIRAEQYRLADKYPDRVHVWIVEERIEDANGRVVPDDFKFYGFQGAIGLVHQTIRDRPRDRHAYFDGGFRPLHDPGESLIWTNGKILNRDVQIPPANWESMLAMASRISVAVPSPFVRIDMYNSTRGPVFGEFTLVPGTFYYEDRERMSPRLSVELGLLWAKAERALRRL